MSEQTENEADCSGISMPKVEPKVEVTNGDAADSGGTSPVPDATTPRPPPEKSTPPQPPPASAPPDLQPGDQAATPDQMKSFPCRDYLRGTCKRDGKCRFRHDTTNKKLSDSTLMFCHDYQNTKCTRASCKFIHGTRTEEAHFYATGQLLVKDETCTKHPACHDYLRHGFCLTNNCSYRHISLAEYNKEKNGSQTPPPLPTPMPNFTVPPPVRPAEPAGITTDMRVPPPTIPKLRPLGPLPGFTTNYSLPHGNVTPEPVNGNHMGYPPKRILDSMEGTSALSLPNNFPSKRSKPDEIEKCTNCELLDARIGKLEDKMESIWPKYKEMKRENENLKIIQQSLMNELSKRNQSAALAASIPTPVPDVNLGLQNILMRLLLNQNQDSSNMRLNMPSVQNNNPIDVAALLARVNGNSFINPFGLGQTQVQTPQNQTLLMAQQIQNNQCQNINNTNSQPRLHGTGNQQSIHLAIAAANANHQSQNQQLSNQQGPQSQYPLVTQQNHQQQPQPVSDNNYFGNQTQQLVQQNAPNNTLQNILLQ